MALTTGTTRVTSLPMTVDIPRYARYAGRKVRVLRYLQNGLFQVLDTRDNRHIVHRDRLRFL